MMVPEWLVQGTNVPDIVSTIFPWDPGIVRWRDALWVTYCVMTVTRSTSRKWWVIILRFFMVISAGHLLIWCCIHFSLDYTRISRAWSRWSGDSRFVLWQKSINNLTSVICTCCIIPDRGLLSYFRPFCHAGVKKS